MLFRKKTRVVTDEEKIEEALTRGVMEVLPTKEGLKKLLLSGKRIRLYQGFDPTGTLLHVGHMVGLRKLAQFQRLGHDVVFLIGDGTGQAGDPGGKSKSRETFFTTEELRKNATEYVMQAGKIVSFKGQNAARIFYNGDWLNKLSLSDVLNIAQQFTLQQMSERDTFRERTERGEAVNLREFLYPLLQGYDSVAMGVDLEIGGTDQTFNMLAGRTLVKKILNKEKFVLTTPLLADSSGKKIGKSEGNVIALTDTPENLFGKIMKLGDSVIVKGLEYLTDVPMEDVLGVRVAIEKENPKKYKELLAYEIVKQLHGTQKADRAKHSFVSTFSMGETPKKVLSVSAKSGTQLMEVLRDANVVSSNTEFRRLVEDGAIRNADSGEKINNKNFVIDQTITLKVGKHRFLRVEAQ